eukprot:Nk52_evm122s485 gene=Nk52_evmTU122s485
MKESVYQYVDNAIVSRDSLYGISCELPGVSYGTLLSIYSWKYQEFTRKTLFRHRRPARMASYFRFYFEQTCNSSDSKNVSGGGSTRWEPVIVQLAEEGNLAPCLLARMILEVYFFCASAVAAAGNGGKSWTPLNQLDVRAMDREAVLAQLDKYGSVPSKGFKSEIGNCLKDPSRLSGDLRLRWELEQCILFDDNYSPLVEKVRQVTGLKYEAILYQKLRSRRIAFIGEDTLREKGYPKTPDTILEAPIGVDGHPVNWIESKASFGTRKSHEGYLRDQYWSYVNRYGPGLVIYWFGFIDELNCLQGKGILLMDCFPNKITRLGACNAQPCDDVSLKMRGLAL